MTSLTTGVSGAEVSSADRDTGGRAASLRALLRRALIVYVPILLLLLPFLGHHSRDAVIGSYSWDYLLFLAGLGIGGFAIALGLIWLVRRARADLQVRFALLMLAIPICTAVAGEVVLGHIGRDLFHEYRVWGHAPSPLMGFEPKPNHHWEMVGATYTTDADTFRTHVRPRVARDEETLIVVMGGSCAFGFGLDDDETWAHRLEGKLRARFGDHITVINAGANGHNTLQQFFRLHLRVRPIKPAIVVHYGATNDVRPDWEADRLIHLPPEMPEATSAREHLRIQNSGKGFYWENSLTLDHVSRKVQRWFERRRIDGNWPDPPVYNDDTFTKTVAMYIRNLDGMRLLCERDGIEFVPVSFIADYDEMPPRWTAGIDLFVRAIRRFCYEQEIGFIDLYPDFRGIEDKGRLFFEDHYHPTEEGADFIAEHVADALVPIIESLPPAGSRHVHR